MIIVYEAALHAREEGLLGNWVCSGRGRAQEHDFMVIVCINALVSIMYTMCVDAYHLCVYCPQCASLCCFSGL